MTAPAGTRELVLAASGSKRCPRCRTVKPLEAFTVLRNGPRAGTVAGWCKDCTNAERRRRYAVNPKRQDANYARAYYEANKLRILERNREWVRKNSDRNARNVKNRYLVRHYGITLAEYEAILAEQGGVCAACGDVTPDGRALAVDHDHKTGRVRGLLCDLCNRSVGLLRDSPAIAASVAGYLARTVGTEPSR